MATNTIGRTIYASFAIMGAVFCAFIVISLIRRLYFNSQYSEKSSSFHVMQPKQAMQPTFHMKISSISCGVLLCIGFILKSIILTSVINGEGIVESNVVLILYHLGNLFMDGGQALYFKYFVLSIRKLYR